MRTILMMLIVAFCAISCSDEEKESWTVVDISGQYTGYTNATSAYFKDRYTDNESVNMIPREGGTLTLTYESATWGTFRVEKVSVVKQGSEFLLSGEGRVALGMGDTKTEYDFTVKGSVAEGKTKYQITFAVPAVMGGLTITLQPGKAPQTETPTK